MGKPTSQDVVRRFVILKSQVFYSLGVPPLDYFRQKLADLSVEQQKEILQKFKEASNQIKSFLKSSHLWKYMTDDEREFMEVDLLRMNIQAHYNATWRLESAVVLMWALRMIDEFPAFDTQTNPEILKKVQDEYLLKFTGGEELLPADVLERQRGIAELWHWRSRTRELIERGDKIPPEMTAKLGFTSFDQIIEMAANKAFRDGEILHIIDNDFVACGKAFRDLTDEEWHWVKSVIMERHYAMNWLCGYAPGNKWDRTPTDT
jgi:hypothetical protein